MILNKFYINNTSFFTKLIIHLLVLATVADLLWFIIMMQFWGVSLPKNAYWSGLSTIHTFALIMAVVEMAIKV